MSFHEGTNNLLGQGNQARETARKQQEAKQDGIATAGQDNLSKEQAKQDQTTTTASEPSEPLPQVPPLLVVMSSSPTKTWNVKKNAMEEKTGVK